MRIIIFLSLMLAICQISIADVYVTYDNNTKEIIDMSKREDVVLNDKWTRVKIDGKLTDYPLQYHPQYYKYENKRFIVNIKKISDEEIASQNIFNKQEFEQQVFDELFVKYPQFAQYYLIISRCVDYNNTQGWVTLKQYIDGLLAAEVITQEIYSDFIKVLKDNHIELNDLK